jgi:hypothetical protein
MKTIQSVLAAMMLALYTFCTARWYAQALHLSAGFGDCENINTMHDWGLSRKN